MNSWMLVVYSEVPQVSPLRLSWTESMNRVEDFYDSENYRIVLRNIGLTLEDSDFVIEDARSGERVAEIEFWPEGYKPRPLEEVLDEAREMGCEIDEE